jgi:DNA-binding transcriptional LysR family regulator
MQQGRIEAFLAVARTGNMSRAADELTLTQPALSARLKGLEEDLQVELFARTSRGMRLTEAGRAFRPYAERSVAALREGQERLRLLQRGGGALLLASAPAVSTYTLPALLERFTAAHPDILISVRTGHSEDVLEMVLREEVQLGLGREIRHPDIERTRLYEDELALVVGPHHRWALQRETAVSALGKECVILFDRSSSYYELTRSLLLAAGLTPPRVIELDNIEAAKRMVERGLGVALLPRSAVADDVADGRLRLVRITDAAPVRRPIAAMRRRDATPLAGVEAFLCVAREVLAEQHDAPATHALDE